jgi:hypothetical protein
MVREAMFVRRNERGEVVALSKVRGPQFNEEVPGDSPELESFYGESTRPQNDFKDLQTSDLGMVRVLEDLIDLLIGKGVITFTDFPDAVQKKLLGRQDMRKSIRDLNLLDEDDETI